MRNAEHERLIQLFGTEVRLLIGPPTRPGLAPANLATIEIESFLAGLHQKLTRFDPHSELSLMNADRADSCRVSPTLALAVRAGIWAAEQTEGLVDPTLVGQLESIGYQRSMRGREPAPLKESLADAPPRRPAQPDPRAQWRRFSLDEENRIVRRPPGLRFDTGGCGKGLAADLAAGRLAGYSSFAVDAGGDVRIGGTNPTARTIDIQHPFEDFDSIEFQIEAGAVATSGLATRIWRHDGRPAHHLLDPSTGRPAWTGLIQVTARGDTALQAETLAKQVLLLGPEGAPGILEPLGGAIVHDDGRVQTFGELTRSANASVGAAA